MAALTSDWLRHFLLLLWNRWSEFNKSWQEARSQRALPSLCLSGRSEKQDGRLGLWLAETFLTSPLKPLIHIEQNLTGSKISTSSTKFVFFFRPIGKTRWPPWPLIGWEIFDFFTETADPNSKKLDRNQDFNVLYHVCVFWVDRKNKMAALASDLLRHFRLLLWNRWTEFNKTGQEARSQCSLQSLCFLSRSDKQDGLPGPSDWLRHYRLLLWNRWTEFNKTWQKARSQRPMSKQKILPWLICQKGCTLYSGARYVALWASCSHVYSLWQDFSCHSIINYLVTLTLKFNLLFKNFNLGHKLWSVKDGAVIFSTPAL